MPLPELSLTASHTGWPPDPLVDPAAYRGVTLRRMAAYVVDAWIIFLILVVLHFGLAVVTALTFGLLWPLHLLVVPLVVALAYHSLQIGGPASATIGMRLFGLRVYSILGGRPTMAQAIITTVCFYGSVGVSGGLLLLVALFNPRRRTLHDFLAGTVVLRKVVVHSTGKGGVLV